MRFKFQFIFMVILCFSFGLWQSQNKVFASTTYMGTPVDGQYDSQTGDAWLSEANASTGNDYLEEYNISSQATVSGEYVAIPGGLTVGSLTVVPNGFAPDGFAVVGVRTGTNINGTGATGAIVTINLATKSIVATIPDSGNYPFATCYDPSNGYVYVSDNAKISVINPETGAVVNTITMAQIPGIWGINSIKYDSVSNTIMGLSLGSGYTATSSSGLNSSNALTSSYSNQMFDLSISGTSLTEKSIMDLNQLTNSFNIGTSSPLTAAQITTITAAPKQFDWAAQNFTINAQSGYIYIPTLSNIPANAEGNTGALYPEVAVINPTTMTLEAMILMPSSTDGAASDIYNASAKDVYFPDYADDLGHIVSTATVSTAISAATTLPAVIQASNLSTVQLDTSAIGITYEGFTNPQQSSQLAFVSKTLGRVTILTPPLLITGTTALNSATTGLDVTLVGSYLSITTGVVDAATGATTAGSFPSNGASAYALDFNTTDGTYANSSNALITGKNTPQSTHLGAAVADQIEIADERGTGVGWNVTGSLSDLTFTGTLPSTAAAWPTLSGATINMSGVSVTGQDYTQTTQAAATLSTDSIPVSVATATANNGMGMSLITLSSAQTDVTLSVPSTVHSTYGLYTGTIIWTLNDTPTGVN
ncbi:WxL domain-containing protein [Lactococcus fujiensis]|nr:WxL domain-containing protein [Lactococcus fujiensis]